MILLAELALLPHITNRAEIIYHRIQQFHAVYYTGLTKTNNKTQKIVNTKLNITITAKFMTNKIVLITGAAKRIGKTIACSMADSGWDVAVHYNNSQNEAEDVVKYIKSKGVRACTVKANLINEAQIRSVFKQVNEKLGVASCLVNNASILKNDAIDNFSSTTWSENMAINLYAPTILMQEFAQQLSSGMSGNIINMLDYAVLRYPEKFMSYTASKSALWTLTQQLAISLATRRIRINGIGPGKILQNIYENTENFTKGRAAGPLGYDSSPEEISQAIEFIISSPSMTGQMIALDGGKHLVGPELY
jgi:NAD(P)-dependent dehydrogenase (short-subunit alcohol dehydrogenase family)